MARTTGWLGAAAVVLFSWLACGSAQAMRAEEKGSSGEAGPAGERGGVERVQIPGAEKSVDLPEIPKDRLPPRTRTPPDPARVQYRKGKVHVRLREEIRPMSGGARAPEVPVIQNYLSEYFRRSGYEIVESAESADYRVEGDAVTDYRELITFREETLGWTYEGTARLQVVDREGKPVVKASVPEVSRTSSQSEESAILDTQRYLSKLLYEEIFVKSDRFADKEVVGLVEALAADPLQAEDPVPGCEIVPRLADIGLRAVPYLLEAMTDTRTVLADVDYPGVDNLELLKVFHLADKALEEIFQKVSRLPLRNTPEERFVVTLGWENEWRRFCPAFRDSPLFQLRLKRWAEMRKKAESSE